MNGFKVSLPDFQGPLDLLLFFIRRDELDIYNIPIAHITKEFLDYIHLMQMLDLELAGEFIVMAATLMQIKARMLLPRISEEESDDEIDPRAELTRRLIEYKRYKEASEGLMERELEQRQRYFRALFKYDVRSHDPDEDDPSLRDLTLFHLIKAFQHALENIPKKVTHEIVEFPYTIEHQGLHLMNFFGTRNQYNFLEVAAGMEDKMQMVVTFIALLELIRAHRVGIIINSQFNDFTIVKKHPIDVPHEEERIPSS